MRERSILLLHPTDEAYGADRSLLRVALSLQSRGWRVRILVSDDQPLGWLSSQAERAGISCGRGPLAPARRRYLSPRQLPSYARRLFRARRWIRQDVESFRPSIVLVNTSALLVGSLIGRPRGVRLVWHVREIVVEPRLASWLFRLAPAATADLTLCVSEAVRLHVTPHGFRRSRAHVLWNALEPRPTTAGDAGAMPFERPREEPPFVAFVGRLNRWKGYEVLVAAAAQLASELPHLRFVIAGDPPDGEGWRLDQLREQIEHLGLTDRFSLPGYVDGPALFAKATLAVVPSTWPEPFGRVTLEAMLAGTPVIATAHGGSTEIIEAGVSGMLVPPGDPAALAGAIRTLMGDPELRRRMAEAGWRRAIGEFGPEKLDERLDQILAGVLHDAGPRLKSLPPRP